MRATRCTLVQMIEQMHPGETLAFEPGHYRTDNPIRVYKAIEIIRHPDYGASVGPPQTMAGTVIASKLNSLDPWIERRLVSNS